MANTPALFIAYSAFNLFKHLKKRSFPMTIQFRISVCLAILGLGLAGSNSAVFAATAGQLDFLDGDGGYFDTGITVNPFSGGNPAVFGVNDTCCVGVLGGTNNVSIDDADGLEGGADSERLDFVLDPGYSLIGIDFIFSRANPIVLSGFTEDPQVSVGNNPNNNISASYDSGSNSVLIFHPWAGGSVTDFSFNNPSASAGQTISLSAFDPGQAGAQATLFEVEWDLASANLPGDVDGDGDVDLNEIGGDGISDFDIIRNNWFNDSSPTRQMGDLNGDGIVEFDDFAEWKTEFGLPIAGSMANGFYVVPEAGSITLLTVGLLSLGAARRRS